MPLAYRIECSQMVLVDLSSIPGCVIPKTLKWYTDTSLLNTQQYKVPIKGKVEQSKERSCTLPYTTSTSAANNYAVTYI